MNKLLLSMTIAANLLGATAYAGQGNSGTSSDAIVAQTPPNVIGEAYPDFGPPEAPIVTDRFGSAVVGETYPRLIDPPTSAGRPTSAPSSTVARSNSIVRNSRNFQPPMGD